MTRNRRLALGLSAALAISLVATGCGGGSGGGSGTLVLWHNYGTTAAATATENLVEAFEKANPDIQIDVRSQPSDNYFPLLQAANISKNGPDLAVMWSGLYAQKYASSLVNLKDVLPAEALDKVTGLDWASKGYNEDNGPLLMPLQTEFYAGFYNKAIFDEAGVEAFPRTWDEFLSACDKIKSAGYVPLTYGTGWAVGSTFYPWYDASYIMTGLYSPEEWGDLYTGETPYTSPEIEEAYARWAELKTHGCTNTDVITKGDNLVDFVEGKTAMVIDGSWDSAEFTKKLGDDAGAFLPPFSEQPQEGAIYFAGAGYSIMKYSQNQDDAAKFLEFMTSDAGVKIISDAGLIPPASNYKASDPLNQQLLDFVEQDGATVYPMIDNVIQPEVVDVGNKVLPSVLSGEITPADALKQLQDALEQLPPERREPVAQ